MQKSVATAIWGRNFPKNGLCPAIALINPKHANNVGMVVRLASCYGFKQVWWTGKRVNLDSGERLPREERMKGYQDVEAIQFDEIFDRFENVTPVAIEVKKNSENLYEFEHPENAVYVFGPEDGSIDQKYLKSCHRFVTIPSRHCLNLATAVATVLWDREYKNYLLGKDINLTNPGEFEKRGVLNFGLCGV